MEPASSSNGPASSGVYYDSDTGNWRKKRTKSFLAGILSGSGKLGNVDESDEESFGHKTIGIWGSFCILFNNLTGPGMLVLPSCYITCGWFVPTLLIIICGVASALSSAFLCEAMTHVPGNEYFEDRVEWMYLARRCLDKRKYYFVVLSFLVLMYSNIASGIVSTAQTADNCLLALFGETCAINFDHIIPSWQCISPSNVGIADSPFGDSLVLSIGYVLVMILTIPMSIFNLDDNIKIQAVAWVVLIFIIAQWTIDFSVLEQEPVPVVAGSWTGIVGTILFNFALATTVPSWANEKRYNVEVNRTIWSTVVAGSLSFIVIGWLGANAFPGPGGDILAQINSDPRVLSITRINAYLFPLVANLSGIPVLSIIIRYNLVLNGFCGHRMGNVWGVIFPWMFSIFFYQGNLINEVINWSGLLVTASLNMLIPCWFWILCRRAERQENESHYYRLDQDNDPDSDPSESSQILSKYSSRAYFCPDVFRATPLSMGEWPAILVVIVVGGMNVIAIITEVHKKLQ